MENKYIIYKYDFPNGKCYIGQTRVGLPPRHTQHQGGTLLADRAIRKYNITSLPHIIMSCAEEETANRMEQFFITLYKSREKQYGYNIAVGGVKNGKPMLGKRHSEETKQNISRGCLGKKHRAHKRRAWTPERIAKRTATFIKNRQNKSKNK